MEKLRHMGVPLRQHVGANAIYRGVLTGLNEAFVVDIFTRNALIATDRRSVELIRPFLRGQDIDRWSSDWAGLSLILLQSSSNHSWPWTNMSGDAAEACFQRTYPAIYGHFLPMREKMVAREDKGRFWWELRSCSYYTAFDQPKIIYTDIAWTAQFCIDNTSAILGNTAYIIATGDSWIAACLNAPLGWWFAWRTAQHGKDEALRYFTSFMERYPIPTLSDESRAIVYDITSLLKQVTASRHETRRVLRDWLQVTWELSAPPAALLNPFNLTGDQFAAALRAALPARRRILSAAAIAAIRAEHSTTIAPMAARLAEVARHEAELSALVNRAYGLTPEEEALIWATAPPRMPTPPPSPSLPPQPAPRRT